MKSIPLSQLGRRTPEPPISWLMHMALSRPHLISLAAGFTDSESLPVADTRELLDALLRSPRDGRAALQYGTTQGDPELRRLTGARLEALDREALGGADRVAPALYQPDRMFITSGSQQLLYVVSECLCDPGDIVLVEDPTYFVYLGILQSHGLRPRGVRLDGEGIDLQHLEQVLESLKRTGELSRVKLLYLVSYFQNPTGVTTTDARKQGALEILRRYERAAGHPLFVLEDAAYRELRFAGSDTPSLLTAPAAATRVLYAGTYSKPFATGVRVGFGILPPLLLDVVLRIKGNHDFGTSSLLQQLIRRALATDRWGAHLGVLRARYARKAEVMARAIRRHFPTEVEWTPASGGLYVWARVPSRVRTGPHSRLFQAALRHDVLYVPGWFCYAEDPARPRPDYEMRLSFGGARLADIPKGIERLGRTLHELLDR